VALGQEGEGGQDPEGALKAVRTVGAYLTNIIKNFAVRVSVCTCVSLSVSVCLCDLCVCVCLVGLFCGCVWN
jgi:hypothetical protein